ncbi:transposase [Streptomyces phaeochromogenes]|uniref:transposase n=1 Tax=Streptomyces phaeochromogenes TaxID=1923 RepID=UPI00340E2A43
MYWYFTWWHDDGTVERIHDVLRRQIREANGRNAEPSAGLIDSQSVRTVDTVPAASRGFDAGKKVKGRKRFIVADTLSLLLAVHVVAASARPPGWQEDLGGSGLCRPLGQLDDRGARPRAGDRPQRPRSAGLPRAAETVGGRAHTEPFPTSCLVLVSNRLTPERTGPQRGHDQLIRSRSR